MLLVVMKDSLQASQPPAKSGTVPSDTGFLPSCRFPDTGFLLVYSMVAREIKDLREETESGTDARLQVPATNNA
jgi:hypothetical protein